MYIYIYIMYIYIYIERERYTYTSWALSGIIITAVAVAGCIFFILGALCSCYQQQKRRPAHRESIGDHPLSSGIITIYYIVCVYIYIYICIHTHT